MSSSSQHRWTAYKGRSFPAPLFIAALLFLTSSPPVAQGAAIDIPKSYKIHNMLQPPILTATPTSFTAFSPEDIYLPCEASGNPPPTFHWMKNGQVFGPEMEESGTLRAEDDEPLDSYKGTYSCYAKNTLGTAITQPVQIIVESQPVLLKQQEVHKRVFEGDSIVLSCHPPQSSTPPQIHWLDKRMVHIKQSDRVTVGLNGKLYFSNVLKTDSRDDYTCYAQYTAARTVLPEAAVRLTVMSSNAVPRARKPHFFVPSGSRSSVLALRGNSLTLECIPMGLPTPKVEWVKRDGSLEDTSAKVENFGRWLYFSSVQQQDDGEYECRASNIHGSVVHSFSVSVEAAPYWVKEPQNLASAPGETVRLDCLAEGIPKPEVTWSINGIPITDVSPDPRLSFASGALILRDVGFYDNAVYQCEASNHHGSILINSFLFIVELPPQILSSDGVVYKVMEGGDVQLHCESFGSPRPYVTWEREHLVPLLSDPRVSLLTNGTIKVSNVTHEDGGVYTCFIKNSSVSSVTKSTISITANLEIYNRTIVHSGPQDLRLLRGSDALLDCRFYKDPRLHKVQVVWKKNGHKLQESSPDDKYTIFEDRTLKVTNVQPDDTAAYSCEVITSLDHVSSGGSITVVAPPDPPHHLTLSDTRDDSLTLSWTPGESHNSPITDFLVEAREEQHQEEVQWRWELWEKVPGDVQHRQLMLHPFSTFSFRVTAVNEQGNSSASRPSERHSTPPAVPSSNPVNVTSNSSEPGTLVITWAEMSKRFHNGQDFQYKVWWRKAKGKDLHWNTGFVKSPPFLVNNTGTFTSFEIKVQAVNALGVGPEPEAKIGHSGEDTPEEPPGGVSTLVKNRTVVVKWNEAQRVRGRLLGYKIYIRRLGSQDRRRRRSLGKHHLEDQDSRPDRGRDRDRDHDPVRVEVVWGNRTSAEVTELKLFSQYELSVTAFNSKGESPASTPHLFITPEGAPGPPASLTFDSPTEKSLILYWTPPLETNGILLGYVVQYQKEGQSMDSVLRTISDPSVNQILLENLDSSSYYILKVIAETRSGAGPPITSRGATLLDGVPPTNVTVVSCNTSFNLSWVPGERDRNHGFHFHYKKKPGPDRFKKSELVNSTQGFYLLTDLQPGSQYHLQIRHGNNTQWEDVKWTIGPVPSEVAGGFAAQGWLIGLISAIVLLVLILLILCLIKRSKGGKYAVKDKEDKEVDSEARPMKDETFGEYSDGDEKRSDSQPSLCNESKLGSDDSLAEYGDSVDIQFNEDGSFIGQYSGRGPVPHGNESSGPASPVNAAPPPPIAPSMSSILNRPS